MFGARSYAGRSVPSRGEQGREPMRHEMADASLTDERAQEIRRRILERAYDSPQVAECVARRILDRGDL